MNAKLRSAVAGLVGLALLGAVPAEAALYSFAFSGEGTADPQAGQTVAVTGTFDLNPVTALIESASGTAAGLPFGYVSLDPDQPSSYYESSSTLLLGLVDTSNSEDSFVLVGFPTGPAGLFTFSPQLLPLATGSLDVAPVPLPTALPMFGATLLGLAGLAWATRFKGHRLAADAWSRRSQAAPPECPADERDRCCPPVSPSFA